MPKGKNERSLSSYVQQILPFAISFFDRNREALIKKLGSLVNFKRVVRRYMILLVISIAALFVILDGLALFVSSYYPEVRPGVFQMVIGLVLILSVLVYNRLWKP
jgi:hypothetical protein